MLSTLYITCIKYVLWLQKKKKGIFHNNLNKFHLIKIKSYTQALSCLE